MYDVNDDTTGVFRRIEVLTGPDRRRRWSADDKARIVEETLAPGARVGEVARRWQLCPQQVFEWRREAREAAATMPPHLALPDSCNPGRLLAKIDEGAAISLLCARRSECRRPVDITGLMGLIGRSHPRDGVVLEMSDKSRLYAIHSDGECERLERQAALAGLEEHLRFLKGVPASGSILDAGCGSGSMARLIAARHSGARVVGVDLRQDYLSYARARAQAEHLENLSFEQGDIFRLPFPDASFDLVWSKYVLQWTKDPAAAVAEFRRVTKPGGFVVCCNFDGFCVTNWPADAALQQNTERVFSGLVDPFVGRKMAAFFAQAGLTEIAVDFEPDRIFTVVGQIDPNRRLNWIEQLTAARPQIEQIMGGEREADDFVEAFLNFNDRPDTSSYTALYFVRGTVPEIKRTV
jgi:SAM-dependent methyltransferase/transposase-like protein